MSTRNRLRVRSFPHFNVRLALGMLLVTLEGLPHSGKACVLRHVAARSPSWTTVAVPPDAATGTCAPFATACSRTTHALFASLLAKLKALHKVPRSCPAALMCPAWYDHLPRHPAVWRLFTDMASVVVRLLGLQFDAHVMVQLRVSPDETFEQMVCCGNPCWNATSLADLRAAEQTISAAMRSAAHPISPARVAEIACPPFFEENEVVLAAIAETVVTCCAEATTALKPPGAAESVYDGGLQDHRCREVAVGAPHV